MGMLRFHKFTTCAAWFQVFERVGNPQPAAARMVRKVEPLETAMHRQPRLTARGEG
jgi:prolyl oligopeptidase PreP (S9A serine peptidase family)